MGYGRGALLSIRKIRQGAAPALETKAVLVEKEVDFELYAVLWKERRCRRPFVFEEQRNEGRLPVA